MYSDGGRFKVYKASNPTGLCKMNIALKMGLTPSVHVPMCIIIIIIIIIIIMWKSRNLNGRHAYDLETPDVDKTASNAWLKASELFAETTGFMIAIQDQVIVIRTYFEEYEH
jgi:hypothetical protein